jgi:MFS family permease
LSGGMVLLLFSLTLLGDGLAPLLLVTVSGAAGLVLLSLYVGRYKLDHPRLLDISLLKIHSLRTAALGALFIRISAGGATFLLPLLFQIGFGLPILTSGALSSVYAIGALTMRAGGPWLFDRFGFRPVLITGSLISAASIAAFGFIVRVDYPQMIGLMLIGGIAQGIVFGGANAMTFADVEKKDEAGANTLSQLALQLAMTLGVSVAAMSAQLAGDPSIKETLLAEHFPPAFHVLAAIGLLGAITFSRLSRREGSRLIHTAP